MIRKRRGKIANKRNKPEEIVSKLRQVNVLVGQGMQTDQLKRLKRLQKENERLRKAVSELTLDKLILAETARGNF